MTQGTFTISTSEHMHLVDITPQVSQLIEKDDVRDGLLLLFNPHTTAGLTINEGADPDVRRDIIHGLRHIVPLKFDYHHFEGNSPSHIMALLTGSSLSVIIQDKRLVLGTWQKIFFCEYDGPRTRTVHWKIIAG